jgi:hypothetical protein
MESQYEDVACKAPMKKLSVKEKEVRGEKKRKKKKDTIRYSAER